MWNSLYVQCENLGRDSLAWYLEFTTFHICPFATGCPKTQINEMELFLSLLHEGKCGHHCFFMKYGSICHSLIYIKTDIFLPESMEFSVSPLSGWKCSLRQSVTSIFQGEKANGDISGRSMVISALPKNFSLWNHWFFFFFFSVRLERVCLYMSVLVRPVFVCVSVWEDGGLLQTINKEMNARGNETCSKQRRNQEVCREGEV